MAVNSKEDLQIFSLGLLSHFFIVTPSVVMPNVTMLSAIMLSVGAPPFKKITHLATYILYIRVRFIPVSSFLFLEIVIPNFQAKAQEISMGVDFTQPLVFVIGYTTK
jgi:hypothetical protein